MLHPLGPAPHLALAVAVIPMAWELDRNLALLILWGSHIFFISCGLLELFFVRRWQWRKGLPWIIVLQAFLQHKS